MSAPTRSTEHPISAHFTDRWSPRAFTGEPIAESDLLRLLEAARWAPSAFNNQPWRFVYVRRETPAWAAVHGALAEFNQLWSAHAAALVVVLSKDTLVSPYTGETLPNRSHSFDAGAAWISVALEATATGWHTHAMTGLDFDAMRRAIAAPEGYTVEAAFAVGRRGAKDVLPEALQSREGPSPRKPLSAIAAADRFAFDE
jgi:nitroreductase